MFKKIISMSLFVSITVLIGTSTLSYAASPQEQISQSKMVIQQLNDKILETKSQISNLNVQMNDLNVTIQKNNEQIKFNENQIKVTEKNMEKIKAEISAGEDLADKRVSAMYKSNSSIEYLSLLMSSKDFSDFILKLDSVKKIIDYDKSILMEMKLKRDLLNQNIEKLDAEHKLLQQLIDSNTTSLQQLNSKKGDLENLISQMNNQRAAEASTIAENENSLISHAVSVIDSPNSPASSISEAISTLRALLPQISTNSVANKARSYISKGNSRLASMAVGNSTPVSRGSGTYKATYVMQATAYSGGGYTATGLKVVRDPDGLSTIAVDPRVIRLGTKVYIPGYGYAICADTGGAIKGNIIDLYMNTEAECIQWGRRNVTLYIVAYPGEW